MQIKPTLAGFWQLLRPQLLHINHLINITQLQALLTHSRLQLLHTDCLIQKLQLQLLFTQSLARDSERVRVQLDAWPAAAAAARRDGRAAVASALWLADAADSLPFVLACEALAAAEVLREKLVSWGEILSEQTHATTCDMAGVLATVPDALDRALAYMPRYRRYLCWHGHEFWILYQTAVHDDSDITWRMTMKVREPPLRFRPSPWH